METSRFFQFSLRGTDQTFFWGGENTYTKYRAFYFKTVFFGARLISTGNHSLEDGVTNLSLLGVMPFKSHFSANAGFSSQFIVGRYYRLRSHLGLALLSEKFTPTLSLFSDELFGLGKNIMAESGIIIGIQYDQFM